MNIEKSANESPFDDEAWNGWAYIVREFIGSGRRHWPPYGRGHWLGPFGSPRSVLLSGFWLSLVAFIATLIRLVLG